MSTDAFKHWKMTRLASLPLIPIAIYFVTQLPHIVSADRMEFVAWAKSPLPSTALFIFIACAYYHASLGAEEIIEDYVSDAHTKTMVRLANKLFFILMGVLSIAALFILRFKSV
jgi:succinate dehydrogenase / fumarate reductase, membrane anchor subunit